MKYFMFLFFLFFVLPCRSVYFPATILRENDLVFDIGAYVGARTDQFLLYDARVVAVEPQPAYAERMARRFAKDENVRVVIKGVGGTAQQNRQLFLCRAWPLLSSYSGSWIQQSRYATKFGARWYDILETEMVTLDDLIAEFGLPRYCLLTVEGLEHEVLSHLNHPIAYIAIEFHKETLHDTAQCLMTLMHKGYKSFNFSIGSCDDALLADWVSGDILFKILSELGSRNHKDMNKWLCGLIYARHETESPIPML